MASRIDLHTEVEHLSIQGAANRSEAILERLVLKPQSTAKLKSMV